MMKLVLLSVVLSLLFANGSALTCINCMANKLGPACVPTTQTCAGKEDTCVVLKSNSPNSHYTFQRCTTMTLCQSFVRRMPYPGDCCQTNNCNNFEI